MKVGDRVRINPEGRFPRQGGGGWGTVIAVSKDGVGLPIHVRWDSVPSGSAQTNVYAETDLLPCSVLLDKVLEL